MIINICYFKSARSQGKSIPPLFRLAILCYRIWGLDSQCLIARFMGPTWGPSEADRTQVGPMLAPWTLLSGMFCDYGIKPACQQRYLRSGDSMPSQFTHHALKMDDQWCTRSSSKPHVSDIDIKRTCLTLFERSVNAFGFSSDLGLTLAVPRDLAGFRCLLHCSDVIMGTMASQITSLTIVYSTVYSGADQRKHQQSSASLALCGEFIGHRWISRTKGQ